ncbi:CDP-alcohol phosphatidyltransferase family protein [Aestuariivirga sp.]|uniref:CDP-alcohol phosphatidyltransferase family protein n=1 Tax=Aestuariivirga sp. TaxID=2650926 RepID=UPI003BAAC367
MSSHNKQSLGQIFADHGALKLREEFATEWAVAIFYRPVALVLTWMLQHTSVTPIMVTLAGLAALVGMSVAAAFLAPQAAITAVVVLACAFMILDCADGPLARLRNEAGGLGQYADFAADICYRLVFYGAAGWVLAQHPSIAPPWLAAAGFPIALGSAWMMTFARLCRVYAELRFPAPPSQEPRCLSLLGVIEGFISGLDGMVPFIAAAAWISGHPQAFFIWVFLYGILDVINTQAGIIGRLRKLPR